MIRRNEEPLSETCPDIIDTASGRQVVWHSGGRIPESDKQNEDSRRLSARGYSAAMIAATFFAASARAFAFTSATFTGTKP